MLSKSRFLSGSQCSKKLYYDVFKPDYKTATDQAQQELFDTGHMVGSLARMYFNGGKDATENFEGDWSVAIERTKNYMAANETTIYEATFAKDGVFAALDIFHLHNEERWAVEVKSSTAVKDYHITDASFQYYVMRKAGFTPDRFFLMHINNQFVKDGDIDPLIFFHLQDITQIVIM